MMTTATTPPETRADRPPPAPDGRLRRLAAVLLGLALVAAAVTGQHFVLDDNEAAAPLSYAGRVGDTVDATRFSARVLSVKAARTVEIPERDAFTPLPTEHVFLIVETSATTPSEPMHLTASLVSGEDKTYHLTDKVPKEQTLESKWIQPGWWSTGVYVFEMPAEAVPGARLVVHLPSGFVVEPYAPRAEIDLGLDEGAAETLIAKAGAPHRLGDTS